MFFNDYHSQLCLLRLHPVKTESIRYNFLGAKAKSTMPTRKRRPVDDLSIAELRHLLLEKEHNVHDQRLAHYQKTGRVVQVTRDSSSGKRKRVIDSRH